MTANNNSEIYESDQKKIKMEICDRLLFSLIPQKGYSSQDLYNMYSNIIDNLALTYGDLSKMKDMKAAGETIGTLTGLGFLRSEQTYMGDIRYRNALEPNKLGPALSTLFKHEF